MSQTTWNRHSEDVYMDATHAVSVQGHANSNVQSHADPDGACAKFRNRF